MTPKENRNENLPKLISGIFGKKFMGTHCNALQIRSEWDKQNKSSNENQGMVSNSLKIFFPIVSQKMGVLR
jgi:hypothetical protein